MPHPAESAFLQPRQVCLDSWPLSYPPHPEMRVVASMFLLESHVDFLAIAANLLEVLQPIFSDRLQVEGLEEIWQTDLLEPRKQRFSGVEACVANSNPLV